MCVCVRACVRACVCGSFVSMTTIMWHAIIALTCAGGVFTIECPAAHLVPFFNSFFISRPKTCHGHAQNAILKVSKSHSGQGTVSASSMTAAVVKSQVSPQLPEVCMTTGRGWGGGGGGGGAIHLPVGEMHQNQQSLIMTLSFCWVLLLTFVVRQCLTFCHGLCGKYTRHTTSLSNCWCGIASSLPLVDCQDGILLCLWMLL